MSATLSSSSSQTTSLSGSNKSTVSVSATVTIQAGDFQSMQSYGYIAINGTTYTIIGPTLMAAESSPVVGPATWTFSKSIDIEHDINGSRGIVACAASFSVPAAVNPSTGNEYHYCTSDTADQPALNYDRKPAAIATAVATVNTSTKAVSVAFTGGASPGGNPALTSTYHVSYSKDGGAFSGDVTGTSSPITVAANLLSPGSNYVFRVAANNASNDGYGASKDAASVFIPSGGKVYNGTQYVPSVTSKIYNGTQWVPIVTAKAYNGTQWVNLT